MINYLKELFGKQDKKKLQNLFGVFIIGVCVLLYTKFGMTSDKLTIPTLPTAQQITTTKTPKTEQDYEQALEKRLKTIYETVDGCGKVSVMLTLSQGKEIVVAEDSVTQQAQTKEIDVNGSSRDVQDLSSQTTKIIVNGDGGNAPLVLKEYEPIVEGVIIVCEGGDDIYVQDSLIRATQTVLGVETHKVQVLKMRKQS